MHGHAHAHAQSLSSVAWHRLQEATQRTIGQFDAAVLEIDAEEAQELARVCSAMQRLRVSHPLGLHVT